MNIQCAVVHHISCAKNRVRMRVMNVTLLVTLIEFYLVLATLPEKEYGSMLQDVIKKWRNTCLTRSGTQENIVHELQQGKFPEDTPLKEYVVCMLTHSGVISKDGTLNLTSTAELAPPSLVKEDITKGAAFCFGKYQNETSDIERLYKQLRCFHDSDPQHFYFP